MAPSHSTSEQVSKTVEQIITLIDSLDYKAIEAYRDIIAARVRRVDYSGEYNIQYALLPHIYLFKVSIYRERKLKK